MSWAKNKKPELIGYMDFPAINWINWFTPSKARRLLKKNGFNKVYDRWDMRLETEGGGLSRLILKIIRSHRFFKIVADVIIPSCSYAAIKGID